MSMQQSAAAQRHYGWPWLLPEITHSAEKDIVALVTAQASRRLEVLDAEGSGAAAGARPAEGPGAGAGAAAVRPSAALTAGG